jgi:hypothetical protein
MLTTPVLVMPTLTMTGCSSSSSDGSDGGGDAVADGMAGD